MVAGTLGGLPWAAGSVKTQWRLVPVPVGSGREGLAGLVALVPLPGHRPGTWSEVLAGAHRWRRGSVPKREKEYHYHRVRGAGEQSPGATA